MLDPLSALRIIARFMGSISRLSLIERLRRSEFRAELIALVAQSRYEMLLRADNERAIASRAVDETHRLIRNLPGCHDDTFPIQALVHQAGRWHGKSVPASAAKTIPTALCTGDAL